VVSRVILLIALSFSCRLCASECRLCRVFCVPWKQRGRRNKLHLRLGQLRECHMTKCHLCFKYSDNSTRVTVKTHNRKGMSSSVGHSTFTHTHTHASVTKQYDLVPAVAWWWFVAGKASAGLALSNGNLLVVTCLRLRTRWLSDDLVELQHRYLYWVWYYLPYLFNKTSTPRQ